MMTLGVPKEKKKQCLIHISCLLHHIIRYEDGRTPSHFLPRVHLLEVNSCRKPCRACHIPGESQRTVKTTQNLTKGGGRGGQLVDTVLIMDRGSVSRNARHPRAVTGSPL